MLRRFLMRVFQVSSAVIPVYLAGGLREGISLSDLAVPDDHGGYNVGESTGTWVDMDISSWITSTKVCCEVGCDSLLHSFKLLLSLLDYTIIFFEPLTVHSRHTSWPPLISFVLPSPHSLSLTTGPASPFAPHPLTLNSHGRMYVMPLGHIAFAPPALDCPGSSLIPAHKQ